MIKAVLFDFNNTIMHCQSWIELEVRALPRLAFDRLAKAGYIPPLDEAQLAQADTLNREARRTANETNRETSHVEDLTRMVQQLGFSDRIPVAVIEETVTALHRECVPLVTLMPGIKEALPALKAAGYRLGVISNAAFSDFLHWVIEAYGLSGYFEVIIVSADFHTRKPGFEIFEIALERMALTPEEVVYVGDDPAKDTDAAKRMGMKAIEFSTEKPHGQTMNLLPPDAAVSDHRDIPGILSRWA